MNDESDSFDNLYIEHQVNNHSPIIVNIEYDDLPNLEWVYSDTNQATNDDLPDLNWVDSATNQATNITLVTIDEPIICPISFEEIKNECYALPCGHQFSDAICKWVVKDKNNTCPMCRKSVNTMTGISPMSDTTYYHVTIEEVIARDEIMQQFIESNRPLIRNSETNELNITDEDIAYYAEEQYTPSDDDLLRVMHFGQCTLGRAWRTLKFYRGDVVSAVLFIDMDITSVQSI